MTLDELCGRTGLSRSTVQQYFRLGIIPPHTGSSFEQDQSFSLPLDFDEDDATCVELVRNLTRSGVSLNIIQTAVDLVRSTVKRPNASALISALRVLGVEQAPRSSQNTGFGFLPADEFESTEGTLVYDRGDSPSPVWGTAVSPPTRREASMISSPQWRRSIGSYTDKELRALKFRSTNEIDKAIDLIWSHTDLRGLPRMTPDGITFIVPEEAVRYFKEAGLKFTVSLLANREELPPERLAELHQKYGM